MPIGPTPQLKASMFGRMPVGGPKPPPSKGGLPAPKGPKGVRIEHRIGVQAPAELIWEMIHGLAGWADWNPLYPKASGDIRIGGALRLTRALPGRSPVEVEGVVLDWVPNEQLHWRTSATYGLVKTIHYVEIEALAASGCVVSCGEIIGGFLGATAARQTGGLVRRGLREMNEALKARAEAAWRGGPQSPTSGK